MMISIFQKISEISVLFRALLTVIVRMPKIIFTTVYGIYENNA
jgi:hypothetical protein